MKIISGALVLCWLSLCRAEPLTCEQLSTKVNHELNLSGRWFVHALSSESCVYSALISLEKPSVIMDITGTTKTYEVTTTHKSSVKVTACQKFHRTHTYFGFSFYSLPSCSDCIVLREESFFFGHSYMLISPKPTIDVAVVRQFETQAECFGSPYSQLLASDYDFSNCNFERVEPGDFTVKEVAIVAKRVEDFMPQLGKCIAHMIWKKFESYAV